MHDNFSLFFDVFIFFYFHENIFFSRFFISNGKTFFFSVWLLFCWFMRQPTNETKSNNKTTRVNNTNKQAACVEVDLTVNAPTSQNLLLDASTSSAVNDLQAIASSFGVNSTTTGSSHDSPSIVSSSSGQQQTKKESHLFGWFASSTSTSTSSAVQNTSNSSSATTASPPTVANRSAEVTTTNGQDGASSPSTKISSKLSYGEMFKFNKNGNKAPALDQPAAEPPPGASKEPQQKSSRRTTSLLNLFMSNSQGKQHIYIQNFRSEVKLWPQTKTCDCIFFNFICHSFFFVCF